MQVIANAMREKLHDDKTMYVNQYIANLMLDHYRTLKIPMNQKALFVVGDEFKFMSFNCKVVE
jgi:hypothetical protein